MRVWSGACARLTLLIRPLKRTSSAFSCWTRRASSSWQPSLSCRSCVQHNDPNTQHDHLRKQRLDRDQQNSRIIKALHTCNNIGRTRLRFSWYLRNTPGPAHNTGTTLEGQNFRFYLALTGKNSINLLESTTGVTRENVSFTKYLIKLNK